MALLNRQNKFVSNIAKSCPNIECRGFLDARWICGICSHQTCSNCMTILRDSEQHVCNKDDIETAKMIEAEVRPCPKCATGISKIDGCDQMWCTQCHTAFSWSTGKLETRNIHNPHYLKHQKTADRDVGDIPCGRTLDDTASQHFKAIATNKMGTAYWESIRKYMFGINRLREDIETKYRPDAIVNFESARMKYVSSQISEETFKHQLFAEYKKCEKQREIGKVLQMLCITTHELIYRCFAELEMDMYLDLPVELNPTVQEMYEVVNYANQCIAHICKVYDSEPQSYNLFKSPFGMCRQTK